MSILRRSFAGILTMVGLALVSGVALGMSRDVPAPPSEERSISASAE